MATTPTPPITVNVASAQSWLVQHERLILIVLGLVLTGWLGTKWISHLETVDQQKAAVTQQQLTDQKTADAQLAAQVQQTDTQLKDLAAQVMQQNAQLASAITQRNTALVTQQTADQNMTNPQVAQRWQQVVPNVAPNSVTATQTGVDVTQEAARATVANLEQIPVLQKNVADLQTENDNITKQLDVSSTLNSQMATQVGGLNLQIRDQEIACKTQVTALNAAARKSKLKWFAAGFVSGFVSGVWVTHAL